LTAAIFKGKERKNNELIIKMLFEKGYMSTWQIANELAILSSIKSVKTDPYHKAQKINSVLIRKDGRLPDLVNKGYIEKTKKGYCLTFNKGFCSALLLFENIPKPAIDETTKIDAILPEFKQILEILYSYRPEAIFEGYSIMQQITIKLLEKGLNFEKISNNEFNRFYADQYEEMYLEELKKGNENKEKWEVPPEFKQKLEEATKKFISIMMIILRKQFQELEDLQSKFGQVDQNKLPETKTEK
jgi:hypothetical protein